MKVIGIFHNADLDGYCSGAIIKKKHPEAKMIGWDYGMPIPEIEPGSKVIMADISFHMDIMNNIGLESEFTWIDHHKSAIEAYNNYYDNSDPTFKAVTNTTMAACELTWKELFKGERYPETVRLLGAYDSWRDNTEDYWENDVLPFQYGMRLFCNSLKSFPSVLIDEDNDDTNYFREVFIRDTKNDGKLIINYQKQQNEYQCRTAAFEIDFKGYKVIAINGGRLNSLAFESVYDESKHDLMMPFQYKNGKWSVSIYSTKEDIDCSEIAKSMGGGGHKGAAGFQTENIYSIIKV